VGRSKKGRIDFVASTARRHRSKRLAPRRKLKAARVSGTRRVARGVFAGRGKRTGRLIYGVRGRRVTFVGAAGRKAKNRAVAKRLRTLKLAPKAKRKR